MCGRELCRRCGTRVRSSVVAAVRSRTALTPLPGAEPIDYKGPTTDSLGIVLSAPRSRGAYRVSFYPAGEEEPAASDELFVVDP